VTRHALEQDIGALPHQPPGSYENEQRQDDRDDRVCRRPAGGGNDRGRGERADRPQSIAQHMEVGAPDIEAAIPDAVQDSKTDQVDQQAAGGHHQEEVRPDRLRVLDPLNCLDHHPARDAEKRGSVDQGREDLPTLIAVGLAMAGRTQCDPGAQEGQPECAGVGQHVARVGQQRQGSADPAPHRLDDHEQEGEGENEA
jgi:hypothetical protein